MINNKSFLSLEFGAGSVKIAEFETNDAGSLTLKQFGIKSLGIEGSQDAKREAALQKALKELLAQGQFKSKQVNVCAPGFHVFSKFVKLPPVDKSKVTQIIQYEAQQNVPYPLNEAVWDYQIMGTTAAGEIEVLLVAIKTEMVEGLFRVGASNNLKLQLVDVSPAALCNSFRFNYGDLDGCTMLLDIGAKTSNILFFEKGKVFARSINIGANSITQDFAAESKLPFAKAEEIKISKGSVSLGGAYAEPEDPQEAAISKIARQVLTRLHIQVNQTIQFYRSQQGGSAPVRLFLAGGGSVLPFSKEFFTEKLNIEIDYFNPFRNIQFDPSVNLEELASVAHSFGEVVGLGLRNLAECPVELNLVPKSIRSKLAFDSKKPYFVASVISLVLVVFVYGWFFSKTASLRQTSLDDLNTQIGPAKLRSEELDKQLNRIRRSETAIDQYAAYLKDRFFWADALVEMRKLLLQSEDKMARNDVGVWIETFGTVAAEEIEEEAPQSGGMNSSMMFYLSNPELARRYFPHLFRGGAGGPGGPGGMGAPGGDGDKGGDSPITAAPPKPKAPANSNTNLVTIDIKFRAVNLNRNGESAANNKLAYAVENEFKQSTFFDSDGTKLAGELESVESTAQTFTFGMRLKLRNPMKM